MAASLFLDVGLHAVLRFGLCSAVDQEIRADAHKPSPAKKGSSESAGAGAVYEESPGAGAGGEGEEEEEEEEGARCEHRVRALALAEAVGVWCAEGSPGRDSRDRSEWRALSQDIIAKARDLRFLSIQGRAARVGRGQSLTTFFL